MAACSHEQFPQPPDGEHPLVATLAVIAIVAAILLITWARIEVHGTEDIEAALSEDVSLPPRPDEERERDAAVTANRFLSP
jgi:hypothetical protein